jgi:hypothetical protein
MIALLLTLVLLAASGPSDTTVQFGIVERDLTGDGVPETLSLTGRGQTIDSLEMTFTIVSSGRTIYERKWSMTRAVGFDAGRRMLSSEEHRARLAEFGRWFFGDTKFMSPDQFLTKLGASPRSHVRLIPEVIASELDPADRSRAEMIWNQMQNSGITIFEFSVGGDAITAIGWSVTDQRFYRLLACC